MEEKELEQQTPSTETPKKGKGGKQKKAETTKPEELTETQAPETPIEQAPETESPVEQPTEVPAETLTETPKDEKPLEEAPKAEKATVVEEKVNRKNVPTIAELRKVRKFNESIFTFEDGFACVATSQRFADLQHEAWLKA